MFRFLFRFAGLWFLAAAFVALVYDGTKSIAGNGLVVSRLGDSWNTVHPASLEQLQPAVENVAGWLWDPLFVNLLAAPTWLVLGVLGAVLVLLGRKKRPVIGYIRE